jgi:hypothetical protein
MLIAEGSIAGRSDYFAKAMADKMADKMARDYLCEDATKERGRERNVPFYQTNPPFLATKT